MDNLINAIDKIVEGQVFKIVISNKKDKENKYNKINNHTGIGSDELIPIFVCKYAC